MDKISRLIKLKEQLKTQQSDAEKLIKEIEQKRRENYNDIAQSYKEFFDKKVNKEFVLYDKFPSVEALELYLMRGKFPLYDFGGLKVKELAEIIKHIYQFKTGKEYSILTIGVSELDVEPVYGDKVYLMKPHLYFMIGNQKTLSPYSEFNGQYVNHDSLHTDIYLNAKGKNLINIELAHDYPVDNVQLLDIECLVDEGYNKKGALNYYNFTSNTYENFNVSAYKNIFGYNIRGKISHSKFSGIKDVFDFDINYMDTYIAKILVSIIIYKRNNQISELTEEDYNHIFDVLFGEKVNMTASIEQDFPKSLVYVPHTKIVHK